jgi:prophage regulatory protein
MDVGGYGPTTAYARVNNGLLTPPIKLGRSSLWPEFELDLINATVIAGKSDDEIRQLVRDLVAARTQPAIQGAA